MPATDETSPMAPLGEILELLHGAAERAQPARLTVVEWRHGLASEEAFGRFMALRIREARGWSPWAGVTAGCRMSPPGRRRSRSRARRGSERRRPAPRRAGATSCETATAGSRGTPTGERSTSESAEEQGARSATYGFLLDPNPLDRRPHARAPDRRPRSQDARPGSVTAIPRDETRAPRARSSVSAPARTRSSSRSTPNAGRSSLRGVARRRAVPPARGDSRSSTARSRRTRSTSRCPSGVEPAGEPFAPLRLELHELPARSPVLRLRAGARAGRLAAAREPARARAGTRRSRRRSASCTARATAATP